jgi:hypothetical protein
MEHRRRSYLFLSLPAAGVLFAVLLFFANTTLLQRGGHQANAGFLPRVYVNSTGSSSDGDCEGEPNDHLPGGDCTLGEAITQVNSGNADSIGFVPHVFTLTTPGVISLEAGDGCLPKITRTGVTIDLAGASVILDGDSNHDHIKATCQAGLVAALTSNGFDFTLLGHDSLLVRNLNGDGVALDCGAFVGPFALRDISITGVSSHNISGRTVVADCPTPTPTPTNTPSATNTPTVTNTPTITTTPTITNTPTNTPTLTYTPIPTNTPVPSNTPTSTLSPTNTRTPTRTPTNTPTPHPGIAGDANCDGVISSVDAVLVLQYSAGLLAAFPCDANADIDHDGAVTSLDAALILQLVAEVS